jgi:Peptidase family M48
MTARVRAIVRAIAIATAAGALGLACARPSYLGTRMPEPCVAHDVEACLGWMIERDLADAALDLYDDDALRDYAQGVADRLARGSLLARAPHIVIADHDGTYATSGSRIVIGRPTIERLDSEAELAGVIAHELAHIEGHHAVVSLFGPPPAGDDALVLRRDAEAIADERAVALLERAGYAPGAMARALRAVLDAEDDEHPLRADRIARAKVMAGGQPGFEGRAELLGHLEHMVVGRDARLGRRVGDAWVVGALGLALELAPTTRSAMPATCWWCGAARPRSRRTRSARRGPASSPPRSTSAARTSAAWAGSRWAPSRRRPGATTRRSASSPARSAARCRSPRSGPASRSWSGRAARW